MKKLLTMLMASTTFFTFSTSSSIAAEQSAYAQVTSNYVFRGQTKTDDDPAIQGGYDIKQGKDDNGWYAGAFASNVTDGVEVDIYGGWRDSFGANNVMGYDVGGILYKYTDSVNTDITELYAGFNYETAFVKLYMGSGSGIKSYNFLDFGASFIVMQDVDLNLHAGRMLTSPSWNYFGADINMEVKGFDLSIAATYEDAGNKNDVEFFVTIGKKFDL